MIFAGRVQRSLYLLYIVFKIDMWFIYKLMFSEHYARGRLYEL